MTGPGIGEHIACFVLRHSRQASFGSRLSARTDEQPVTEPDYVTIPRSEYSALFRAATDDCHHCDADDPELRTTVKRTAAMGSCSQTHHEHLAADARAALLLDP